MKFLSKGSVDDVNYTTPARIAIDVAGEEFNVGAVLGMEPFDVVEICIALNIEVQTLASRTFTLTPVHELNPFGITAQFAPVSWTFTPIDEVIKLSHTFIFSMISSGSIAFYLEDDYAETINVDAILVSDGSLPLTGGYDVQTVGGVAPMDENDIAGVILDDPTTPINNDSTGKVAIQANNRFV